MSIRFNLWLYTGIILHCVSKKLGPLYTWQQLRFFVLMAHPFCHINYDLFFINFVIFNKISHTVYEIQMFKK